MLTLNPTYYISFAFILIAFAIAVVVITSRLKYYRQDFNQSSIKKKSKKNTYWKAVKGKVIESRLEYRDVKRLGRKPVRQYRAHLGYEFFALDNTYTNPSVIQGWTDIKKDAEKYVNGLPIGSEVVVRFDPDDPENSVMELKPSN